VSGVAFQFAGKQVPSDDTPALTVYHDHIQHFVAVVQFYSAQGNLAAKCLVGTDEQLLTGLTAGIERTANLCAPERAIIEQTPVFAGERDALCDALVNDIARNFGEAVHVGFPCPVIASFNRIVKQAVNGVAVVAVILSRIDTTLSSDGVSAPRAIVEGKYFNIVTQLA
jgi:hypothetical protein